MRLNPSGTPGADLAWLPVVERIYRLFVDERVDAASIAHRLNDEGVRTPRGAGWSSTAIVRILQSSAYVALIRFRGALLHANHEPVIDPRCGIASKRSSPNASGRKTGGGLARPEVSAGRARAAALLCVRRWGSFVR